MKKIPALIVFASIFISVCANPGDDKRLIYSMPFAQVEGEYLYYGKDSITFKLIKKLESKSDRSSEDSIDLGYAYFVIKENDKAIKEFERAIDGGNLSPRVFNMIGGIYFSKGDEAKAEAYYGKTLEMYPDNSTALYNMAEIFFRKGNYRSAKKNIQLILKKDDSYFDAHELLGRIAQKEKKYAEAEKYFRHEIELYASSPKSHRSLADLIAKRKGDIDEIIHHYRLALDLSPYNTGIRKLLIAAYEKKGGDSLDIARKEKSLLSLKVQNPVLYNYAMSFVRKDASNEDYKKAISILEEQLKRNPGYLSANLNIGVLYSKLGESDKSFSYYMKELQLNPNNISACYNIAFHFMQDAEHSKTRREEVSNLACAKGMFYMISHIDPFDEDAVKYQAEIDKNLSGK